MRNEEESFLPCQALANALKPDDFDSVLNYSSDNPDIIRYLKCETLTTDVDNKHGWQLVSVDDFPLGWGKLSNNILKTCICLMEMVIMEKLLRLDKYLSDMDIEAGVR